MATELLLVIFRINNIKLVWLLQCCWDGNRGRRRGRGRGRGRSYGRGRGLYQDRRKGWGGGKGGRLGKIHWTYVGLSVGRQGHVVLHSQVVQNGRVLMLHVLVADLRRDS